MGPVEENIKGSQVNACPCAKTLHAPYCLFCEFRVKKIIDDGAPSHIIAKFSRLLLAPPVGLHVLTDDHDTQVPSFMGDELLSNETLRGVTAHIVQDLKPVHEVLPISYQEYPPASSAPIRFQDKWKWQ